MKKVIMMIWLMCFWNFSKQASLNSTSQGTTSKLSPWYLFIYFFFCASPFIFSSSLLVNEQFFTNSFTRILLLHKVVNDLRYVFCHTIFFWVVDFVVNKPNRLCSAQNFFFWHKFHLLVTIINIQFTKLGIWKKNHIYTHKL